MSLLQDLGWGRARAVVGAPDTSDTLSKGMGPGFPQMKLDSTWGCGVSGLVLKKKSRGLLLPSPMGFFDGLLCE